MKTNHILLVEDDSDDIELFREALNDGGLLRKIDVIMQGDQVIPFLQKSKSLPDVIVLDLNVPKTPGKEILSLLKASDLYRDIPVVILTTSNSKIDMEECLDRGAKKFITKPVNTEGFQRMSKSILEIASE
jgi:CheY-like chemotaxis protein